MVIILLQAIHPNMMAEFVQLNPNFVVMYHLLLQHRLDALKDRFSS